MFYLLLVLMVLAAALAVVMRPIYIIAEQEPRARLAVMIPQTFGDWREETQSSAQIIDPQQQATIEKIYAETLSRTYVDTNGSRVML